MYEDAFILAAIAGKSASASPTCASNIPALQSGPAAREGEVELQEHRKNAVARNARDFRKPDSPSRVRGKQKNRTQQGRENRHHTSVARYFTSLNSFSKVNSRNFWRKPATSARSLSGRETAPLRSGEIARNVRRTLIAGFER